MRCRENTDKHMGSVSQAAADALSKLRQQAAKVVAQVVSCSWQDEQRAWQRQAAGFYEACIGYADLIDNVQVGGARAPYMCITIACRSRIAAAAASSRPQPSSEWNEISSTVVAICSEQLVCLALW